MVVVDDIILIVVLTLAGFKDVAIYLGTIRLGSSKFAKIIGSLGLHGNIIIGAVKVIHLAYKI